MAITNDQFLQSLYVAYWGRAADPSGFFYWDGQFEAGTLGFADIAENFALSTEAQDQYAYFKAYNEFGPGAITDTMRETFVEEIYQNMFNRAADADGKAYWVEQLKSGAVSPGAFIATIADSAIQAAGDDAAVLENNNKAAAAEYFTNQLVETGTDWTESLSASFEAILAGVGADTDLATIQAEADDIISGSVTGDTFVLTPEIEEVTGTENNDLIRGVVDGSDDTYQTGDSIDGAGGVDKLQLTVTDDTNAPQADMVNVEQAFICNLDSGGSSISAATWDG
ncbi:MAG: DUF4214 domain-containing protein, partial [Oceanidesulfovibrio sp.]